MIYLLNILFLVPAEASRLIGINDYLYQSINGLAGRSWVFDTLMDLPLESNLVKAGVIGACFMFAWFAGTNEKETARRRRILLITLVASVCVIATTKTLSKTIFLPRPFIQSQKTFHLDGNQLVESDALKYRVPLDDENQKSFKALQRGEIVQNDLGSFPSDHAGFYMTIAVGILLACRNAGMLALAWTLLITLGSRVLTGQHSPLDIAAGSIIGIAILFALQLIIGKLGKRLVEPLVGLTFKHTALSAALVFIFLFEATDTLQNVRRVGKVGVEIGKHLIRG